MADMYDPKAIEGKWQQKWQDEALFKTPQVHSEDKKAFVLDFFPYPSGAGLHVGHFLGYTGSDVIARVARMQGKKVLHPMGWDAFGLPAENYAIKSGVHPAISTKQNIAEFKRQFSQVGISYDWDKEINTSDPEYYKWTQWMFSLLYKRGLAYRKDGLVNWCPKCQTVLANEQVKNGRCERCDSTVSQKQLNQWYFKITDYADRLLKDLDVLDWPEKIKSMQRNWIGKSEGARVTFLVKDSEECIEVFTTRLDTLYGATYLVVAPEHAVVASLTTSEHEAEVTRYLQIVSQKTELERTFIEKEKTGVFTGSYAVNPLNGKEVPIWVADYVLGSYGTGAIMAVPAHDERDFQFATQFNLPIKQVIESSQKPLPFTSRGVVINSEECTGLTSEQAIEKIISKGIGQKETTFRIRDWLVSRQRFWGCPIPIVYDAEGKEHLLDENQLPVVLPMDVEFQPTGQSPLVLATEWKTYTDPKTGVAFEREVDTLDTFVCSSWYYLRFPTPHYAEAAFDAEAVKQWLPVDVYLGGAEHAVLHLLYARFFTKVLFDAGYIDFEEPFVSLRNQGLILGPDHNKMSKSKGNVISPDEVIAQHGADTLRVYELFMAPFEMEKPWSTSGIVGIRRFLDRVWKLRDAIAVQPATELELKAIHKAIKKVSKDIDELKFNTAISCLMETVNSLYELPNISSETYSALLLLLNPFAPHITEELWQHIGMSGFCSVAEWPHYDKQYLIDDMVQYPVQINGKVKFKLEVSPSISEDDLLVLAKNHPKTLQFLEGKHIVKQIIVPGRLISLVIS